MRGVEFKTKKILHIMYLIIVILAIVISAAYISFFLDKEPVLVARGYIPEGVIVTPENFDELFLEKKIAMKDFDEKYFYKSGAKLEISKNKIIGNRIKYTRIKGDRIGPDVVEMTPNEDPISYMLYYWSQKLGVRMVGKYIKLAPEDTIMSKSLRKGIDTVRIKFGRNVKRGNETIPALGDRYGESPVLDFAMKGKDITGIIVGVPENLSNIFDQERKSSKYVIVEYLAWRNKDIKEQSYKKIVFQDEVDAEYNNNVTYKIGGKADVDVTKLNTKAVVQQQTTTSSVITK